MAGAAGARSGSAMAGDAATGAGAAIAAPQALQNLTPSLFSTLHLPQLAIHAPVPCNLFDLTILAK
jgi:hypothetical protein